MTVANIGIEIIKYLLVIPFKNKLKLNNDNFQILIEKTIRSYEE